MGGEQAGQQQQGEQRFDLHVRFKIWFKVPRQSAYFCIKFEFQYTMKKRDKILQEAKSRLVAAFGDKIKDVILFGSRAWGKPHRWSDWDFVVVVRGDSEYDWKIEQQIRYVMFELDNEYEILTQTLVITEGELAHTLRGAQPIFQKAISEGIHA